MQSKVLIGLVIVAILVGAGASILLHRAPETPPPTAVETTPPDEASATVTLYWLNSQGDRLVAVKRTIKEKSTSQVLNLALQSLIKETPPDDLYSAIPKDTEILDLQADGQDIRLNLSSAFGRGGGTTAIQGRLIQVLYTLTSLEPSARVFLSIEGKPVTYLGGEGIEVKQPMTRQDYPEIL